MLQHTHIVRRRIQRSTNTSLGFIFSLSLSLSLSSFRAVFTIKDTWRREAERGEGIDDDDDAKKLETHFVKVVVVLYKDLEKREGERVSGKSCS